VTRPVRWCPTTALAGALVAAACAAGPRPDFTIDLRVAHSSTETRDMWYGLLANRYGCDTVMVKARGGRTLGPGATACQAAQWVGVPTMIRSWAESTQVIERWDRQRSWREPVQLIEQWDYQQGCTLHLEGSSIAFLYVRRVRC